VGDTGPAGQVCTQTETVTPGSVIADQLNTALNTGSNKLVTADEINELVSALLNQAITQVVGGIGNGLKGLSEHDTSNGGKVFTEQMAADSTRSSKTPTVDYFGNAQDTSGSNPDLYKSAVNSQGSTQTTQPGNNPVSNPTSPTGTNGPGPIRTP
jgi:hypothetical protein